MLKQSESFYMSEQSSRAVKQLTYINVRFPVICVNFLPALDDCSDIRKIQIRNG